MSSYLGISAIDNGIIRLGNNGYGGIAYRAGAFGEEMGNEEGTSENGLGGTRDPTRRFLTEQNLALFWRRPGILPSTRGLLNPLFDTQSVPGQSGLYNRPPGNIRHDCPPIRYRGRNLLAGQILQEKQDTVRLWAVNDFSDHKLLLQYNLRIKEGESEETGDGRRHKCIKVRASKNGPKQLRLRDAADQLRAMEDGGEGQRVFVRTKCYLQLAEMGGLDEEEETEEDAASKSNIVYKCPAIRSFAQIPHMEDEIAIVDGRGQLFWGRLDDANSFSRAIKPIDPILEVCPTDCPRLLLSLSAQELREVDLREPPGAAPGHLLHSLSPLAEFDSPFGQRICDQISARDKFWHLAVPDIQLETAMVTTTRQHMLVDRRMPGLLLLAMEHTELGGADYCLTVPAFTDPESGSRIFSHYALTHVRRPALSHWSFAFHPKEALWSSLGPKYEMDSPRSMVTNICRPHTQPIGFDPASLPQHTRAIHYQPLHPNLRLSSTRALLFRQMEGGEVWFENVFFDPLPKLRQNVYLDTALEEMSTYEGDYAMEPLPEDAFRDKCLARIRHFQSGKAGTEEAFYREIDKKLLVESKFQKISALELLKNEVIPTMPNIPFDEPESMDPFATFFEVNEPKVDFYNEEEGDIENRLAATISGIGDDRLFSKCVNTIWEKTSPLCEERAKHRVNKVVEQHIGGHKVGPASLARNADQMDDEEMEDEQENRREEGEGNGEEEEAEFRAKMDELKIVSGMKGSEHLETGSKKRRRMDTDEKLGMAEEVEEKSDEMCRKERRPTKRRPSAGGLSNLATPTEREQQAAMAMEQFAMKSRSKMRRKALQEEAEMEEEDEEEEIGGDEADEGDGEEAPSSDNGNDDEYNFDVDLDNLY